jgi:hypothetical protein
MHAVSSKQVGLFPCRGSVVPCRTLSVVSATCHGTVKPGFARPAVSEREAEGARKRRQGPSIRWGGSELPDELNEYRLVLRG